MTDKKRYKRYEASMTEYGPADPSLSNVKRRCRQEKLEDSWSEDWRRTVDESRITPVQYILIAVMILLLVVLLGLGAFWVLGRSKGNSGQQRDVHHQLSVRDMSVSDPSGDIIAIPDADQRLIPAACGRISI